MWHVLLFLLFLPTAAEAGAVSVAVALLSSSVAVATGAIAATAFWSHFAVTFALSTAAKLLSPDVKDVNAGNNLTGYDVAGCHQQQTTPLSMARLRSAARLFTRKQRTAIKICTF
jgi:hypothetical protein